MKINEQLKKEFKLNENQIKNLIKLFTEKATIPFIARYRKEATGNLDEIILRNIKDRYDYFVELNDRKKTVIKTISEAGKLDDQLKIKIENCIEKSKLEDIYLPYKPKKKSRAKTALEKGLKPLADFILQTKDPEFELEKEAKKYVNKDTKVETIDDALKGASDIIAEHVAENSSYRDVLRNHLLKNGQFISKVTKKFEGKKSKYEMYYNYKCHVKDIKSHNMLALRRAEKEEAILFNIDADPQPVINHIKDVEVKINKGKVYDFLLNSITDGYERLMKNSITAEIRLEKKREADIIAIKTFESNLREVLLSPPAGPVSVIAIDPGFRTGCKVVALDKSAEFKKYQTIFPNEPHNKTEESEQIILDLIKKYNPEFIAIGNGTASRETLSFINNTLKKIDEKEKKPAALLVNESGASVYSASKKAIKEFPDLDVTVRGAISIGRRLIDPLSELVKIDPKSIGVGQYQHDVDQSLLKKKLAEVVESCVNFVGVDINSASAELLSYVSGLNSSIAESIIKFRQTNGLIKNRQDLMSVPKLGSKTFEQCAGFLRIKESKNPLDNSAVHPESYYIVEKIAKKYEKKVQELIANTSILESIEVDNFVDEKTGSITIKDIIEELKKPARDPRKEFKYAKFKEDIKEISDLKEGMILEGVITNVTDFGAFVDIGVHQDGLVHVSKISKNYVQDPKKAIKTGQIVKVKVLNKDETLKRISLSMILNERPKKSNDKIQTQENKTKKNKTRPNKTSKNTVSFSVNDLIKKFNN